MNTVDQLLLAGQAYVPQHRAGHLAELILDEIQPGAGLRREHKTKRCGTPSKLGRMVVQHQTDLVVLWIALVSG